MCLRCFFLFGGTTPRNVFIKKLSCVTPQKRKKHTAAFQPTNSTAVGEGTKFKILEIPQQLQYLPLLTQKTIN